MEEVETHFVAMMHSEGASWPSAVFHDEQKAAEYVARVALLKIRANPTVTLSIDKVVQPKETP